MNSQSGCDGLITATGTGVGVDRCTSLATEIGSVWSVDLRWQRGCESAMHFGLLFYQLHTSSMCGYYSWDKDSVNPERTLAKNSAPVANN